MIKILIVEDDAKANRLMCSFLNDSGYNAVGFLCANDAYNAMCEKPFDLIISDVMMPGIDGFEFAETVRSLNQKIPIMFVTAKDDIISKQKGFRIGIDDYMVKPIDIAELVLRVGALLRRANIESEKKLTVGSLVLDADAVVAYLDGKPVPMSVREFNILFKLLSYPNKTFSRSQLMNEFWSVDSNATLRAVDVNIARIREKLANCKDFKIVTVHGLGYKAELQ